MTRAERRSPMEDGEHHAPCHSRFEPCDTPCHAAHDCGVLPALELGICGCETCAGGLSSAAAPDRSFPARRRIDAHGRGRGRRAVAFFPVAISWCLPSLALPITRSISGSITSACEAYRPA